MRKWIFAIAVPIYMLLSSGVVVHLHYCMDRLAEIGFFVSDHQDVCGDCGMDMNEDNDCCHDKTDVIKLKQDQTVHPYAPVHFKSVSAALPPPLIKSARAVVVNGYPAATPQPEDPISGRYRYRLIEVFRI